MSYVVLARKWRPQSFEDLVGQSHVSRTLANAIARDRVAHAFLFTGVRGVGKTTSARILAKALDCVKGPTATPCQVCPQCQEITIGQDIDVQEIDGASYNGVDEVRRLQETLPYRPSRDRFKIFIVDEVHMLSTAAWNAFLKTLEEPPPHVKFIFATTEVHKVPVTILSRCQRYDFKLIGAQMIASRLKYVLEQEKVAFDDAAVSIVAREAAGSMRDAMSLLDQVLAALGDNASEGSDRLTPEAVARVLGVADRKVMHDLSAALVAGDPGACVQIIGDLAREGYDLPHVARDVLAQLRDLVVAKVAREPGALLDLADVELADVKALADKAEADDLTRLHQGFSKAFDDITKSGQPRAALEMTLVRLARRPPLYPVDELLRRLADLERRLGGGSPGGAAPDRGGRNPPPPRRPAPPETSRAADPAPAPVPVSAPVPVPVPVPDSVSVSAPASRPPVIAKAPGQREASAFSPPVTFTAPTPRAAPAAPPIASPPPIATSPSSAAPAGVAPVQSSEALAGWRDVLARVRARRPALASVLEHAALLAFGEARIEIGYETGSFLVGQANDPAARELLDVEAAAHFGKKVDVVFSTVARGHGAPTVAQLEGAERKERHDAARKAVEDHPLVAAAIQMLGAELRDVRLADALE